MFTKKKAVVSLQTRSATIVQSISSMQQELISVNAEIENERTANQEQIDSLQAKNDELQNVAEKNAKIAKNIATLLGE